MTQRLWQAAKTKFMALFQSLQHSQKHRALPCQNALLLQPVHEHWDEDHSWSCHDDPAEGDHGDALTSCHRGFTDTFAFGGAKRNTWNWSRWPELV